MLKKNQRLKYDKDFDQLFKIGRSFYGPFLGFKTISNNLDISRFGILVGTKVSKKAVVRNKIKRQIRGILSQKMANIKPGNDLVIITFPKIINQNFVSIEASIEDGLKRLKILI